MNLECDYYTATDIQTIIGIKKSLSYEILRKLRESFIKEFPDAIDIQGKIPKWYFEKKMHNKKVNAECVDVD